MGISFNVAFQKKIPRQGLIGRDFMALGQHSEAIDALAKSSKLATIDSFVSIDPAEAAEMSGMDPEELGLPPAKWFDPSKGLKAIQAIMALLRDQPTLLKTREDILADLAGVEKELEAAKTAKVKFRFCFLD